jgi:hypothetical protein
VILRTEDGPAGACLKSAAMALCKFLGAGESGSRSPTWWGPRIFPGGGGDRDPARNITKTQPSATHGLIPNVCLALRLPAPGSRTRAGTAWVASLHDKPRQFFISWVLAVSRTVAVPRSIDMQQGTARGWLFVSFGWRDGHLFGGGPTPLHFPGEHRRRETVPLRRWTANIITAERQASWLFP